MEVTVGVSNRHVHLNKEHLDILFGNDYELNKLKNINQPGQYASLETVTLKTVKNEIKNVRILGPIRNYTQVEISKTDAYYLGINPPIRKSGDIIGSSPIEIIGPKGVLKLSEGCIIADRHIHMLKEHAKMYGFNENEKVMVIVGGEKGGILDNVNLRIADNSYFEMHLDTDDANAHMIKNGDIVRIMKK